MVSVFKPTDVYRVLMPVIKNPQSTDLDLLGQRNLRKIVAQEMHMQTKMLRTVMADEIKCRMDAYEQQIQLLNTRLETLLKERTSSAILEKEK